MKKTPLIFLPLLMCTTFLLPGCNYKDTRAKITYGSLVANEATYINYGALKTKINNQENMLVVLYQEGISCGCWTMFSQVINEYVRTYHTKIYKISAFEFGSNDNFGLTIITDVAIPSISLFKNGKLANEFIKKNNNKSMFEDIRSLRSALEKITKDPSYMYVDQAYLDNKLFVEKERAIVLYERATCGDCSYVLPNILKPYVDKHDFDDYIYFIDLDVNGIRCDEENNCSSSLETYINFKNQHGMSEAGNSTFGYATGVVPTMQIWENGEIKDMTVTFNDTIVKENDQFVIKETYYTSARVNSLKYTNEVLLDRVIPENEILSFDTDNDGVKDYHMWVQEKATLVHGPILESFLDYYLY